MRVDSTVVATAMHYPVDSTLLGDGVRVLNRALQRAKLLVQPGSDRARTTLRDRTRSVQRVMRRLSTTSRQRGEQVTARLREEYQRLIHRTEQLIQQACEARNSCLLERVPGARSGRRLQHGPLGIVSM